VNTLWPAASMSAATGANSLPVPRAVNEDVGTHGDLLAYRPPALRLLSPPFRCGRLRSIRVRQIATTEARPCAAESAHVRPEEFLTIDAVAPGTSLINHDVAITLVRMFVAIGAVLATVSAGSAQSQRAAIDRSRSTSCFG
jgi:hypothetical protein